MEITHAHLQIYLKKRLSEEILYKCLSDVYLKHCRTMCIYCLDIIKPKTTQNHIPKNVHSCHLQQLIVINVQSQ